MPKKRWTIKRIIKTVWVILGVSFLIWQFYSFQSHGVDEQLLETSDAVTVTTTGDYYSFTPNKGFRNVFVFYPGALVAPKAYVPICRKIADNGIKVYLVKMPLRLATRGYNKPKDLHFFADTTKTYILSGHSQGAKMAAQFVYENPSLIDKLILIGTTHPRDISLAGSSIPIMKIYGSRDGVADKPSIMKNKSRLSASTTFVEIKGGNHAQFGYYGYQLGDNSATISRAQQQAETVEAILDFINK